MQEHNTNKGKELEERRWNNLLESLQRCPCEGCHNQLRCGERKLACTDYERWQRYDSRSDAWIPMRLVSTNREPSRTIYNLIFENEQQ